jgi:hypothetical protein
MKMVRPVETIIESHLKPQDYNSFSITSFHCWLRCLRLHSPPGIPQCARHRWTQLARDSQVFQRVPSAVTHEMLQEKRAGWGASSFSHLKNQIGSRLPASYAKNSIGEMTVPGGTASSQPIIGPAQKYVPHTEMVQQKGSCISKEMLEFHSSAASLYCCVP